MSLCLLGVYISLWGFVLDKLKGRYHAVIAKRGWPAMSSGLDYRWRNVFQSMSTVFWWNAPQSKWGLQWNINIMGCGVTNTHRQDWPASKVWYPHPDHTPDVVSLQLMSLHIWNRLQWKIRSKLRQPGNTDGFWCRTDQAAWWLMFGMRVCMHSSKKIQASLCPLSSPQMFPATFKHLNISHFILGKMFSLVFCHYNLLERVREWESANVYKTLKRYLIWRTLNFKL